ncbi:hypothetical protein [Streptomyces sp. NPDC048496]|uniref:hypothetical protein n=1 Tax=Streptomyces sp. NPDC048496 TaxID=3365558 RepID=UPI0037240D1F
MQEPAIRGRGGVLPELIASAHGLELAPIPVTATGPDLDAFDRLCRARPVRALYL